MAGIAASLALSPVPPHRSEGSMLTALSDGLAARGPDAATRRSGAAHLLIRAVIPTIHEAGSCTLVIDGIAEASTLAARYAQLGPTGLIAGADPYSLICVDAARSVLVLACNGDGPPLYHARTASHALAASEPAALLAAGVPAVPDPSVVARFLDTGACDEGPETFFTGVIRVLPGEVVEITAAGTRTHRITRDRGRVPAHLAVQQAVHTGRIGIRLAHGIGGAAVLGAALARSDQDHPLAVYSTTFPGLPAPAPESAAALLGPLATGAVRHRALPFFADEIDIDALLVDLGEPVPDLQAYLLWATARTTAGEVDALVDAAGARSLLAATGPAGTARDTAYLPRLADRVASRLGVALRFPFHDVTSHGEVLRAELSAIVERTLPASAARFAGVGMPAEPALREVLLRMRAELLTTFLPAWHSGVERRLLGEFQSLAAGRRVDADALFRQYVLRRWLHTVVEPAAARQRGDAPVSVRPGGPAARGSAAARPVVVAGAEWARHRVCTEAFVAGDKVPEKIAWYVAEQLARMAADRPGRGALRRPWCVLVAARPVAVAQGLARCAWDIRPGRLARALSRFAGPATGLTTPWAAQVAIELGGPWRLAVAAACARAGRRSWYERLASPAVRSVSGPREDAVPPGNVAVVPPPDAPDRVAADVLAALRSALPPEAYEGLAGCAVVGVSDVDLRILGWAGRGGSRPDGLVEALGADNPFGQGGEHRPVVLAVRSPRRASDRTPARPLSARRTKGRR